MKILALDSATRACSVALWDGRLRARRFVETDRGHAEMLLPMITQVMQDAGMRFAALDRLAVTIGPGYFTGLRAGLAAMRGIALASGVPVVGMTTLLALAHGVPAAERAGQRIVAALESKRAELFVQLFDERLTPLSEPISCTPAAAAEMLQEPILLVGDGAARLRVALGDGRARLATAGSWPDAAVLAEAAAFLPAPPQGDLPMPLYLHPPEAQLPQADGRRRP